MNLPSTSSFSVPGYSRQATLALIVEVLRLDRWTINHITLDEVVAHQPSRDGSYFTFGIQISGNTLQLLCRYEGQQSENPNQPELYISSFKLKVNSLLESVTQEELELKFAQLQPSTLSNQGQKDSLLDLFKPTKEYFVTPILMILNITVFILMILSGVHFISPTADGLIQWGANQSSLTLDGQWWRLLTCMFIHVGILHLLVNMYALASLGSTLEPLLGKWKFLMVYALTGIFASLTTTAFNPYVTSAGASGAIFGIIGIYTAILLTPLIDKEIRFTLLKNVFILLAINIAFGLSNSSIDNSAHMGGLISGIVLGFLLYPILRNEENKLPPAIIYPIMLIGSLTLFIFAYSSIPNKAKVYNTSMDQIHQLDREALAILNELQKVTDDRLVLQSINETGIPNFLKCDSILREIKTHSYPTHIEKRNAFLQNYISLRLKSFNILKQSIEENTDKYLKELQQINQELQQLTTKKHKDN